MGCPLSTLNGRAGTDPLQTFEFQSYLERWESCGSISRGTRPMAAFEPGSEEAWRSALQMQRRHLRQMEEDGRYSAKMISDARRRVDRIWKQGRSEWQAPGRHNKMPLPQPVEKPE